MFEILVKMVKAIKCGMMEVVIFLITALLLSGPDVQPSTNGDKE